MAGPLVRLTSRIALTRPARWISSVVGWRLDPFLLRLSGGRLATTGVIPAAVLETTGARTGRVRRNAVICIRDGDRTVIAASHAGAATHPAWFHNLCADPQVVIAGRPVRAVLLDDEIEIRRWWRVADEVFPGFAAYRDEAAAHGRRIPLVELVDRPAEG